MPHPGRSPRQEFARAWMRAIAGTSYVPMDSGEIEDFLLALTDKLVLAFTVVPFDSTEPYQVGRALVRAHFTGTETLGRTIAVLGEHLLAQAEREPSGDGRGNGNGTGAELKSRLAAVQGALAAGFAAALRERTLDEQEAIRDAVLLARDDAERALQQSEARFRALFEKAAVGIAIADIDGHILNANEALAGMLRCPAEELVSCRITDFLHPDDAVSVRAAYTQMSRSERDHFRSEKRLVGRDGMPVWTYVAASLIRDGGGVPRYTVAMFEDVTDRHQLHVRLRYQAMHDPLTGLPNRALFAERLREVLANAGPRTRIGLCYLDLDGFKVVNDSLGHDAGDELLVTVSRRLDASVSQAGHLVARMGGDEFVILVEGSTGNEQVITLADQVLDGLAEPVRVRGHQLSVSASMGIVERPVATASAAELLQAADITLYWAKSEGRGRWALFDAERNARQITRHTLSAMMPAALERDEFVVDYQPLVSLPGGALIGVEALVRWHHPDYGLIMPDRFVELAEETGLIVPLGRHVLARACGQARAWRAAAGDAAPFVSVNLAVRQCRDPGLVSDVARILEETGLDPRWLQLEITESAIMGTDDEALAALRTLASMGLRIAIDDFGTGYSNLAYLRQLPVHGLKIAGSFVEGLRADSDTAVDTQIVATLVSLAHALDLAVTAEGVETRAQAHRLESLGCDAGQGWLFARPGPPERITAMLAAGGSLLPPLDALG
ncbi:MAG TPA: bifunctional diguanylate cyclase/phosphodiesterase [Mycobacteriales bacterium]|nr:bifunctional diguanylate cyclase/phosphodiesterase [Mycobacteriales bacterium]